jgi:hypothetical protein
VRAQLTSARTASRGKAWQREHGRCSRQKFNCKSPSPEQATVKMKSPDLAAALLALPLIFTVLGVVFGMNYASNYTLSFSAGGQSISATFTLGNTQFSTLASSQSVAPVGVNGRIVGPCPGVDQCQPSSPLEPNSICVPSSAWGLIIVNQLFASVTIILLAAMTGALCARRGSRMIHQCLTFVAAICMLLAVATVMAVPTRFFPVCYPISGSGATISVTLDFGGQLPPPALWPLRVSAPNLFSSIVLSCIFPLFTGVHWRKPQAA